MDSPSYTNSPFEIPPEDIDGLYASQGFGILRTYLASQAEFCAFHEECDQMSRDTWMLHRDILHALTMPVFQLFVRASALAASALSTRKSEDLELAFQGDARGAFVWLQCFLSEDADWCRTMGCPACITSETLSTEAHIRLTIASSLLSTASISSPNSSPATSTPSTPTSEDSLFTADYEEGLTLPPLPHILPALREALNQDTFWGPGHWSYLLSRATQLSAAIQALINSCVDLEASISAPASPIIESRSMAMSSTTHKSIHLEEGRGAKLRKSKLAKRQLRMHHEEQEIMRRCALQCWAKAAVPSKLRHELLGKSERRRSLTCP